MLRLGKVMLRFHMDKEIGLNHYKGTIILGGGHEVEWDGIHGGPFGGVEDEPVFSTFFGKDDKNVWREAGYPQW